MANILPRAEVPGGHTCCLPPAHRDRAVSLAGHCSGGPRRPAPQHGPAGTEGGSFGPGLFHPCRVGGWEQEPLPLRLAQGQLPVSPQLPALGRARRLRFEDLDVNIVVKEVTLAGRKKVFEENLHSPCCENCLSENCPSVN